MTATHEPDAIIVGAGLAGSLLACFLARRGMKIDVYERRPDPRAQGFIGGRSINLALSVRGLHALRQVGLAEQVLEHAIPMPGRMMHARDGQLTFQPYGRRPDEAIHSVSRSGLNIALLEAANAYDNVRLIFDHRCEEVDLETPSIRFTTPDGDTTVNTSTILGTDGAFSAVRGAMQITDRFSYSQTYLEHGYKELTIPPTSDGAFAMEAKALHIWPRGGSMMIALPNHDRSFTCTLFWPFDGDSGFAPLTTDERVMERFERDYCDAIPLIADLLADFRNNPVGSLVTVRCAPWARDGRAVVLGDAAHAIVPFYGQGMNAAFEDCTILDELIEQRGPDWDRVLPEFAAARKPDADAIADLALENFIEMRDKVSSRLFVARRRLEKRVHGVLPDWFVPVYNLVTFSRIPYAQAQARGRRQERVLWTTVFAAAILGAAVFVALMIVLFGGDATA